MSKQLKTFTGKFKVGDVVKVTRKANSFEGDWKSSWQPEMSNSVGKSFIVKAICFFNGYELADGSGYDFNYPEFILEYDAEFLVKKKEYEDLKNSLPNLSDIDVVETGKLYSTDNIIVEAIESNRFCLSCYYCYSDGFNKIDVALKNQLLCVHGGKKLSNCIHNIVTKKPE